MQLYFNASLALYMLSEGENVRNMRVESCAWEAILLHFDMSHMQMSILALVEVFTHCIYATCTGGVLSYCQLEYSVTNVI